MHRFRLCSTQDIPAVCKMAIELCKELNFNYVHNDCINNTINLLKNQLFYCFVAVDNKNNAIGCLGLFLISELHNEKQKIASEQFFYVMPQHRGVGIRLLKYALSSLGEDIKLRIGVQPNSKLHKTLKKIGFTDYKMTVEHAI